FDGRPFLLTYNIASKRNQYIEIQTMKNKGIIVFDIPSEKDNIKVNPVIMPTIVEAYAFPTLITGKIMSVYMSLLYFFLTFMLPTNRSVRDVIDVAITSIAARE
ncbi:hypothetical protein, partial [Enterobacter hormaechei]